MANHMEIQNIFLLLGGSVRSGDRDLERGREEEEGSERGQCKTRGVSGNGKFS